MPVSSYFEGKGKTVLAKLIKQYGEEKGKEVFYALAEKHGKKP